MSTLSKNITLLAHLLLALACWLGPGPAWAQSPTTERAEARGKVVDESGLPIEGIAVEVLDAEGRSLLEARSDHEG